MERYIVRPGEQLMTRQEIHIKSVLRKHKWQYDPKLNSFHKWKWKGIEKGKKSSYLHVALRLNVEKKTVRATFFTDLTFNTIDELEKYYVVYNRVKGEIEEMGLQLL